MSDKQPNRVFPTAFKMAAIGRMVAGESVLPLARELGLSRKLLHDWRKAWDRHGPAGLNRKRGRKPGVHKALPAANLPAATPKGVSAELAVARARIAELERKIGQQALDIDFFQLALRALGEPQTQGSPVPASQKPSKP